MSFAVLPRELVEQIFSHFTNDTLTLSRLGRACKLTQHYVEPYLYSNDSFRNEAVLWGCENGRPDPLRRIAACGGIVETVIPRHSSNNKIVRVSTLYLAIKRGHLDVVRQLLQLGVSYESMFKQAHKTRQIRNVVKRLISSQSIKTFPALVQELIEGRLDDYLQAVGLNTDNYHILLRLIKEDAPLELVKRRLDHGDNPNRPGNIPGTKDLFSPLSLSIVLRRLDTFQLLLTYGAVVEGPEVQKPTSKALHVPSFAGAYSMAVANDPTEYCISKEMMQLCIKAGADINRKVRIMSTLRNPIKGEVKGHRKWKVWWESINASPLHVFVDAIESWRINLNDRHLCDRLEDLVRLGVLSEPRGEDEIIFIIPRRDRGGNPPKHSIRGGLLLAPSALEFLVAKWHVTHVATITELREVVRTLVKVGGASHDHSHLLSQFTIRMRREYRKIDESIVFAQIVLANVERGVPASRLLWQYLQDLRDLDSTIERLGKVHYYIIKSLIHDLEADVNVRFPELIGRKRFLCSSVYLLCRDARGMERSRYRPDDYEHDHRRKSNVQKNVLRILLSNGATVGPSALDSKDPLVILSRDTEKLNADSQKYLRRLARILKGKDKQEPQLYSYGERKWIPAEIE